VPLGLIAEAQTLRALDTGESLRQAALKYEEALPLWRRLGKPPRKLGPFTSWGSSTIRSVTFQRPKRLSGSPAAKADAA